MSEIIEFTISKLHLKSALDHYRDTLILKFQNRFFTPAFKQQCQDYLNSYQRLQAKKESNPVWKIPVKILCDAKTSNLDVDVADGIKLKLIDP